jgi:hypothetical protein
VRTVVVVVEVQTWDDRTVIPTAEHDGPQKTNKHQTATLNRPEWDTPMSSTAKTHVDPLKPWLDEFKLYLSTSEAVPEGMNTIEW